MLVTHRTRNAVHTSHGGENINSTYNFYAKQASRHSALLHSPFFSLFLSLFAVTLIAKYMNIHIYISYLEELEAESILDSLYILNSLIQFYQSVTRERA